MNVKFSEDVVPVTALKTRSAKVLRQVSEGNRPVLLTSRGHGIAVVQSLAEYERQDEEREFLKAVVQGLQDVEKGRTVPMAEVKTRLGLK
jgi:prevent-host-death family protein